MARYDEEDAMSNMSSSMNSSSENNLRSRATARESYSEQRLRKNAKPVAKAKPKAKPVVGRAGAQTPGQRAKLAPAKSPDEARARYAASKPKATSTGGYPRGTNMPYKSGTKLTPQTMPKKKNVGSRLADLVTGANKPKLTPAAKAAEQAKLKKAYDIAMAKKKRK